MVYIYLAEGFEETEMIAPLDLMRRADLDVKTVSVTTDTKVKGSHGIEITADLTVYSEEYDYKKADLLMLPGGMPGTKGLESSTDVKQALVYAKNNDKYIAAICAAPSVIGKMGFLQGKSAVCYPGFEKFLIGAKITPNKVEKDGKFITGVGMGAATEFGLKIVETLVSKETADKLHDGILA